MTDARACPNVLAHGTCNDSSCKYEHNVYNCELCTMVFDNRSGYDAHVASRQHLNRTRGEPGTFFYCPLCSRYPCGMANWKVHISSNRHITRATRQGVASNVLPEVAEAVPGHQFCVTCNRHILDAHWTKHLQTPAHKQREQFVSFSSVLEEAEKDKNGVSVAGNFDFNIIDPIAASTGLMLSATIQTSVPSSRIALVEFKLASSKGRRTASPFTVSVEGTSHILTYRSPLQLSVTMRQAYFGRSVDRLELLFEDLQLKKRFMISRTLEVIVGSKEDHDLLKPRAPYVPRKRTTRQEEKAIVEGEFPPSTKAIPYVDRLPHSFMPKHLETTLENGSTKDKLARLKRLYLPRVVNSETYAKHFKHLLWAEEFQMDRDLEYYDIPSAQLKKFNNYYYLDVPGLAEKRPSVLVGDRILVHRQGTAEGHWYEGGVHVVRKEEVGLRFNRSFVASPSDRSLVRFKLNRYPMRRQHQAMDYAFSQDRALFPVGLHLPGTPYPRATTSRMRLRNQLIGGNIPQLQAVVSIARQPPGSVPFVIFGPPGTGKTVTMVEAIFQVLDSSPTARVLACAPSNSAADLITSRLKSLSVDELFRAYAPSRNKEQVPIDVLPFTYQNRDGHFSVPLLTRMKRFRVIVTTCVSANIVSGIGITRGHYSHIFVDEAGQATEPEAMIAIKTMADNNTNIILSGDPKQLGPIIRSGIARELGLETSYLERLMKRDIYDEVAGYGKCVVKLVKNFRSHNAILKFPNERFYRGDLQACGDAKVINSYLDSPHVISKKFPIVFHAISGKDDREASSPSFFNIDEVTLVKSLIQKLRSDRKIRITDNDIGVIAPYHAQVLKLRNALRSVADAVKVGSVEEFQGQERRVIIVSTVRSSKEFVEYDLKHTLGFVANPRRFNVAVTRAQALLYIVGDPSVLSLDPLWRSFLNYIHENGGWTGQPPTWDTSASVEETGGYDSVIREAARDDMNEFTRLMESLTLNGVEAAADDDGDAANIDRPWNEME